MDSLAAEQKQPFSLIETLWNTPPSVIHILHFIKQQSEIYVNTVELCAAPVHLKVLSAPPAPLPPLPSPLPFLFLFDVVFILGFFSTAIHRLRVHNAVLKLTWYAKPAGTH